VVAVTGPGYHVARPEEQFSEAQRLLDLHATSSADGRCLECGTIGPCYKRETAVAIFSRYLWLPRRVPGATQPEQISVKREPRVWFGCRASLE
jgi:hypothetical protein